MKPEQQIAKIVRDHKLIDPAELADLETMLQEHERQPPTPRGYDAMWLARTDLDKARRRELLEKLRSWIKPDVNTQASRPRS